MLLERTLARIRQWTFPPEWRIEPAGPEDWSESAAKALADMARESENLRARVEARLAQDRLQAQQAAAHAAEASGSTGSAKGELEPGFAIGLCNEYFRLQRNLMSLREKQPESKEVERLGRVLENIDALMKEQRLECLDLAGQAYDVGRNDFEPLGRPEEVEGLLRPQINRCERPLVLLAGKVIQKSRGVVARPPQPSPAA